jgi:phage protein D
VTALLLENLSSNTQNFYAPRFEVEIENKKLDPVISKAIMDVSIEEKINDGASVSLTVHDEFDMARQEFKYLDHPIFKTGNKIAIKLGYGDKLYAMFMGTITAIEPSFFSGETPTLTLEGQDTSNDFIKKSSPEMEFVNKTNSEIAGTIAKKAGLLCVIDKTDDVFPNKKKDNNETCHAFLEQLAKESGRHYSLQGRTLYFVKSVSDKEEIVTLELGKDLISFNPAMRITQLFSEVEVRCNNPADPEKPFIGKAPKPGAEKDKEPGKKKGSSIAKERYGPLVKVISNISVKSKTQADEIARLELDKASRTLIEGRGECIGIPQIRTGVSIKLNKIGKRFGGRYYVTGTTHTINDSGYRTRFIVTRDATWES